MKLHRATWIALVLAVGSGGLGFAQQSSPQSQPQGQPPQQQGQQQQPSQQQTGVNPVPPLYQPPDSAPVPPADQVTEPDNRPVSGIQELTLGSTSESMNSLQFGFQISQMADSDAYMASRFRSFEAVSSWGGNVMLTRSGRRGQFSLAYNGGQVLYPKHMELNSATHTFNVAQSLNFGRWSLLLSDTGGYSPQTPWGQGFIGGSIDTSGGLDPDQLPDQSVFTTRLWRVTNTSAAQVQYDVTPRTALTVTGSYSFMRFIDGGLLDSNEYVGTAGYSWQATERNSIGVQYQFRRFQYVGGIWYPIHSGNFRFGRRITGRLALDLSAGLGAAEVGGAYRRVWTAAAAMTYTRGRNHLEWNYAHAETPGIGTDYIGADTHRAGFTYERELALNWQVSTNLDFSRHVRRDGTNHIRSGMAGVDLSRRLGRGVAMDVNYSFQRQIGDFTSASAFIPADLSRHLISFRLNYSFRPILLGR